MWCGLQPGLIACFCGDQEQLRGASVLAITWKAPCLRRLPGRGVFFRRIPLSSVKPRRSLFRRTHLNGCKENTSVGDVLLEAEIA
jgi:hypothetical protein